MAKQRKLNNIDPIRRSQISDLMKTSPSEQVYLGDFRRGTNFVESIENPETILRWFRILSNDEASAAAAAGLIYDPGLSNNDMDKRSQVPCSGGPAIEEPAPSMWAIEQARYNCGVIYRDKYQRFALVRFPSIPDSANLSTVGNALKDNRVLCWYNSNSGHWETDCVGNTSSPSEPSPGADNVTFVSVAQTTGGALQCDFQERNNECVWPGHKVLIDSEGNFCSTTAPYTTGEAVWIVSIEGCVGLRKLDLRDRYLAIKIADAFDVAGDTRQLWGIRPAFDHPMEWIYVSESLAFEWSDVDSDCIYDGNKLGGGSLDEKTRAKQRLSVTAIDPCIAAFAPIDFTIDIYCIEVNNRPFVRNRVYLGWKSLEVLDIGGIKRPLFYFDSTFPPQQIKRYVGSDTITTLGTTPLSLSPAGEGGISGVTVDIGSPSEIEFTHPGRYRVDLFFEVTAGAGSTVQAKMILEQWVDLAASWGPLADITAVSWDNAVANVYDSSSIALIVDIAAGDKLRLVLQNPSALRTVNCTRGAIVLEFAYEEAV